MDMQLLKSEYIISEGMDKIKWFLFKNLGEAAWRIQSEKYYWNHRTNYYKNLQLGVNYYEVKYDKSIPFLRMLLSI